ncbi:unnamed protein product [Fraxinus pennsylvanica]|uniref:Glabrous enhancer-binding protein-like DBD domain-containing protein n=1 Tax=Fraxinus pennsylvanica TaxID=56036 RepID=A0AAD1YUF8_9LAMI|nr:unnamed protein product [Fraxinus pennsylvanica]
MLPGEHCSSTSGLEPEKSTGDNPNEDNVDEDDPERQDQDSEISKEETVNDQQVEADQERGDDHQTEKEEMEEPTVGTPTRLQIECGLISSTDDETNKEDETAEEYSPHSSRKRERESSEEENEDHEQEQEQEDQEQQGDEVEEQQEQRDGEGDNADQNSPEYIPEQGEIGHGEEEQEEEKEVEDERGKAIAEEEKKDDGVLVDPETLQTIVNKSGGSDHYDDSDSRDIEILKAMLVYQVHEGRVPFNDELHELLKNSSEVEITVEELEMKYLVLQAKFEVIVEEKGEGHVFDRPYCQEMFFLSKCLWGSGL